MFYRIKNDHKCFLLSFIILFIRVIGIKNYSSVRGICDRYSRLSAQACTQDIAVYFVKKSCVDR